MSDIFDQASDIEEADRQQALARQRAHNTGPDLRNVHCNDCGEPIDPARRAAVRNCRRCIACERQEASRHKFTRR